MPDEASNHSKVMVWEDMESNFKIIDHWENEARENQPHYGPHNAITYVVYLLQTKTYHPKRGL